MEMFMVFDLNFWRAIKSVMVESCRGIGERRHLNSIGGGLIKVRSRSTRISEQIS